MSRDAYVWRWYAEVTNDLRHTHERAWFGREVTGNNGPDQFPGMVPDGEEPPDWDTEPDTPDGEGVHQGAEAHELYGDASEPASGAEIEGPAVDPPQMEPE